jgi:hypothetical protein
MLLLPPEGAAVPQHEIVNDTVGGVPVAVTYCSLCASGVAFDRHVGDRILAFGGGVRPADRVALAADRGGRRRRRLPGAQLLLVALRGDF